MNITIRMCTLIIAKCHHFVTIGKTKTAKLHTVERFFLVEMRRIELLYICSPVYKMSVK